MTRHKRHLPLTTLPPKTWPFMRVIALTAKNNRFTHQADKTKKRSVSHSYRTQALERALTCVHVVKRHDHLPNDPRNNHRCDAAAAFLQTDGD